MKGVRVKIISTRFRSLLQVVRNPSRRVHGLLTSSDQGCSSTAVVPSTCKFTSAFETLTTYRPGALRFATVIFVLALMVVAILRFLWEASIGTALEEGSMSGDTSGPGTTNRPPRKDSSVGYFAEVWTNS